MTQEKQLSKWLKGNSIHNFINDTCCPDFSCCYGKEFLAEKWVRERFVEAYLNNELWVVIPMLIAFEDKLLPPEVIIEERRISMAIIH